MKKIIMLWLSVWLSFFSSLVYAQDTVTLTPDRKLSIETVNAIASGKNIQVALSPKAKENIKKGHDVIMRAALNNKPVYGLTVGVGWNKDHPVFIEKEGKKLLSPDLLAMSKEFNLHSLRAHASGIGPYLPESIVRAAMVIRLNTFLNGEAGVSPQVAQTYVDFLNHHITPLVPSRGSLGEADITLSSHIGLAMIGEWDVLYQGKERPAKEVMQQLGLPLLEPIGKDFLSILSTNSLVAAQAVDIYTRATAFSKKQVKLFAMTLEALNGNIAPFSYSATQARPYPFMQEVAKQINDTLAGSDLFKPNDKRALQDPLSYRSMAYSLGELNHALSDLKEALLLQINHSDDNPLVLIHGLAKEDNSPQMQAYKVDEQGDAIVPTSNFNFLPVATAVARTNEAMAKIAEVSTQQILRLENPELTKLARFLAADSNQNGHAFGAIQKPFVTMNQEIKMLAQPQWFYSGVVAGTIEDTASYSEQAVHNADLILNDLYNIASYQLLHAAQALDLRKGFILSKSTQGILQAYRKIVPFADKDMVTTRYIEQGKEFWERY